MSGAVTTFRMYPHHLLFALLLALIPAPIAAKVVDEEPWAVGARIGTSLRGEDITQADMFLSRKLPWSWSITPGWDLTTAGELTLSGLHRSDENGASMSISTDLFLTTPLPRLTLSTGVGAGLMEDPALGDYDFGGSVFFLFHAGAAVRLTPRLCLGYRYGHQSNGHIYENNPSLNLHQLELRWSF